MPNVTMAFDEGVKGWTSEFTFVPDSGLSLNNNYYTFNNGRVYRHNSQLENRNTFYGISGDTTIELVFNESATAVKTFKSINYEGKGTWETEFETNIEKGTISSEQYVLKEGENYAWIRGESQLYDPDFSSSSVAGIGAIDSVSGDDTYNFTENIPFNVNVGDLIYNVEITGTDTAGPPILVGLVQSRTETSITTTETGLPTIGRPTVFATPVAGNVLIYVKDNTQEKSGIIGYYNITKMTNTTNEAAELFSVNANTFITTV